MKKRNFLISIICFVFILFTLLFTSFLTVYNVEFFKTKENIILLNLIFLGSFLALAFLFVSFLGKLKSTKALNRQNQHKETTDTLNGILTSMDDGIIAIDTLKKVVVLTPRAKELLIKDEDFFINDNENSNYQVLKNCLSKSLEKSISFKEEISVDDKVLQIYTTPIIANDFNGVLAVISDVTRIKELEQIRSEFVANVTHELKTPLTSIRGYIELLKNPNRTFDTQKQFYEIIEIEAERLQNLIDDILSLSVIEHGQVDADVYNTNIKENVEKVVSRLNHVSEKNNVKININIDENVVINANPDRLQQLIWNLTENAIKYNKENGEVNISSRQSENQIIIEVADTGIGIKNEHLARIFERFYRVDKDRSRQSGGTGLGLSIVKHILFLYEGEIFVESEYGRGTKFIVKFPIKNKEN